MKAFLWQTIPISALLRSAVCASLLGGSLFLTLPAFAGLGEDAGSVDADQAQMQGARRVTQSAAYSVHEIKAPTGVTVREYVSKSGQVFGVAWQGPWPPDMRQILANNFETYRQASEAQVNSHNGRRPLVIDQHEFVMHAGGHMRSFNGRAFIPALLPNGVTPESIR